MFAAPSAPRTRSRTNASRGKTRLRKSRSTAIRKKRRAKQGQASADIHRISHKPIRSTNYEPARRIEGSRRSLPDEGEREYAPERNRCADHANNHSADLLNSDNRRPDNARLGQESAGQINEYETDKKCCVGDRTGESENGHGVYSFRLLSAMPTIEDKRREFRRLHETGCFAIPNPWDIGTAKYLQHLGFKAIATTSAGFAFSRGLPDGSVERDDMLAHIRELVEATDIPVNADFENGYADDPNWCAENARLCAKTGVAGLSIEDAADRKESPIYDVGLAVERIHAVREALHDTGVLLVGRAEGFLVGRENIDQVIKRLVAYSEAGADCLYAPGFKERDQVKAIVEAVAPKPVNILVGGAIGLTMHDAADLGARRVSVGGAFARAAWGGFIRSAKELMEKGTFDELKNVVSYDELQSLFRQN
jgi:2-methylisocitrate lyase-like PEP mutase family enzyme